jgi:hypothetical protein
MGESLVATIFAWGIMEKGTIIFYGRLTYLDVLKAKRWTGFIYRWHADGTHERLGDRYPKYVECERVSWWEQQWPAFSWPPLARQPSLASARSAGIATRDTIIHRMQTSLFTPITGVGAKTNITAGVSTKAAVIRRCSSVKSEIIGSPA